MKLELPAAFALACLQSVAIAQGTFIYDQQSVPPTYGTGATWLIEPSQPVGQSFTPTLTAMNFVRISLSYLYPGDATGSTVVVHLRSDSITGPILASSRSVSVPAPYTAGTEFFFDNDIPLTPGTTYYFQPQVISGSTLLYVQAYHYFYDGGTSYYQGAPNWFDLWFQEGIYRAPEPSTFAIMLTGLVLLVTNRRTKLVSF